MEAHLDHVLSDLRVRLLLAPLPRSSAHPPPQSAVKRPASPPAAGSRKKKKADGGRPPAAPPAATHPPPPHTQQRPQSGGKGGAKDKKYGQSVPKGLLGKAAAMPDGRPICFGYNLEGCKSGAAPGNACPRGLHVCAEPGCYGPHSQAEHPRYQ